MRRSSDNSGASDGRIIGSAGETEVGDGDSFDALFQQDVRWFDVAMDQSLSMRGSKAGGDLYADSQSLLDAQWPVAVDAFLQRDTSSIRHHQKRQPMPLVDPMNSNHVVVSYGGGCLSFASKSFSSTAVGGESRRQNLDRDVTIE